MNALTIHIRPADVDFLNRLLPSDPRRQFNVAFLLTSFETLPRNECWEWKGRKSKPGYGLIRVKRENRVKNHLVHRISACLFLGMDYNSKLEVCHKCDNPPCFNPYHLFVGTHRENMADRNRKGRQMKGENAPKAKLTEKDVLLIRRHFEPHDMSVQELADMFGVRSQAIYYVLKGKTWKHLKMV